ncbi:MAG: signal peptide peptidase SppA [Myxococcales bacterium]|nr:signal peptide peptidase SppA [Myxococcales bacterium]
MEPGSRRSGGFFRKLGKLFMFVGIAWSVLLAGGLVTAFVFLSRTPKVPARTVLELRLDRKLQAAPSSGGLMDVLNPDRSSLRAVLRALDTGAEDDKVQGLLVYVGGDHGLATLQELRDAIVRFRKAGKFAYAFAHSFGEVAGGTGPYYLATACDEIWIQPSGSVGITGLRAEVPFVKELLAHVGVKADGQQRKSYKTAFNTFTQQGFTEAHAASTASLLEDTLGLLVADIAAARKLEPARVKELFAQGPFLAEDALGAKLVDHIGYHDQVLAAVKGRAQGGEMLYTGAYLERHGDDDEGKGPKVAVIYGVGTIVDGKGQIDPLSGSATLGAKTIAAALRQAARDKDVKAVIFRIDSPGGSYVASDTIWRETVELRNAGKPLIVSMGDVAASGGYFVAAGATKIVAEPATLTGSIGVYAFKLVTKDLWDKLGVSWGTLSTSPNADLWSSLSGFSPEDHKRLGRWLDFVYDDFTSKVALGRKMSAEAVEAVAQGRVFTGARAKELGLVDELGGMETALALAKEAAGLPKDKDVELVPLPERQGLLERLWGDERDSSEDDLESATWNAAWLERAATWAGHMEAAAPKGAPLQAPVPALH